MNRLTFKALQIFIFLMLSHALSAQKYEWTKTCGGNSYDYAESSTIDASGNIYTCGVFRDIVDFDPSSGVDNHTVNGNQDVYIQKLDSSGNFIWVKTFGGPDPDWIKSISVDSDGNVYTIGYFKGTLDLDPSSGVDNHTSNGSWDIFVQKLSPAGNFIWAKTFGGTNVDYGLGVAVDRNGSVYSTGSYSNSVDFDPSTGIDNHISNGESDVFIQKLDSSGNFQWAKTFGGTDGDLGAAITSDNIGNVYTTGNFTGIVDFDPSGSNIQTANGNTDVFIQKIDSSGNFVWVKTFGGADSDISSSITVDGNGNVFSAGNFSGTVDFDPAAGTYNQTSYGASDIYIQKLNSSGMYLWAKTVGGTNADFGFSIAVDTGGNAYTTGIFQGTIDLDPSADISSHASKGSSDVFILKLDQMGAFMWARTFGGTDGDLGQSISVDDIGNTFTTGSFASIIDGDPSTAIDNYTSNGSTDIFIHKLSYDPNPHSSVKTAFGSYIGIYPNPSDGHFTVDLGEKYRSINMRITDVTGRLIKSQEYSNAQILDLSIKEPKGVYILTLESEEHKAVIRLMLK